MKKHLVAFLSMIGLASTAAPARGQGVKGSGQESKIKTESKIKESKLKAEKNAVNAQVQDKRKDKWAKADAENKAVKTDLHYKAAKADTAHKDAKTASEIKADKSHTTIKMDKKAQGTQPK